MVFLLGRLSLEELRQLALHVGLSTDELISCVDFSRADEHPALALRRAQLGALVFGSLPTGLFPEELAHRMNCDLSVVYETIRDALEHQPDGIRLCITGDGRLVHRADEGCLDTLGPDPETLAEPGFRLESPQLAASLWQLCQDKSADGIPAQHVAALRAARLIVTDGRDTRPVADVAHSLQFY